ncbi:S41 family peptidase [bacterium]|nr:S41 family peptidase [bacterium]
MFHFNTLLRAFIIASFITLPLPGWSFPFLSDQSAPSIKVDLIPQIVRSVSMINQYYYASSRVKPLKMLQEGLYSLSKRIPELLIEFPDENQNSFKVSLLDKTKTLSYDTPQKLADILQPVSDVFNFINETYKGDVKSDDQQYAFITGILKPLDPHSNLLTPDMFKEFQTQTSGEYGGIGIVIGLKDDDLTVISPIDNTPAQKAGVKAEDKILEIDHLSTVNMPLSEAVERLRGKVNTNVLLKLSRKSTDPWEINLTRKKINIESVTSKVTTFGNKTIGILSIKNFQEDTFMDMDQELKKMKETHKLDGLVLDLRNNPGGLLDQSIQVADRFLESGDIVLSVAADDQIEKAPATPDSQDDITTPMVVLVNEGSASASEIVSGALKNNNRALVVGNTTFGKGSIQSLYPLRDGASIKLTIAQYLTPGKESIQAVGITPDIRLYPMLIADDTFDIWDDKPFKEASFDEHLENTKYTKVSKPTYNLPYLQLEKKQEESQYVSKIDEQSDYPLSFALRLLSQFKTANRTTMIPEAKSVVEMEEKSQDKAITMVLEKKGINWHTDTASDTSSINIDVSSRFTEKDTGKEVAELKGGREYTWTITINNKSTAISRVIGVVDSENPIINQKEFVFGRVDASSKKEASVHFKVPPEMMNFNENTKISLFSDSKDLLSTRVSTVFKEKDKPLFAYKVSYKDGGASGLVGNANGIPEKGETVRLDVTIKNISKTVPGDVIMNLSNTNSEDNVNLKTARLMLGEILPNAEKQGSLVFSIGQAYNKDKLSLTLSAVDKETKAGFADDITFNPLDSKKAQINPVAGVYEIQPVITISESTLQPGGKKVHLTGTVSDDQNLKDITIYAGGKKVYYSASATGSTTPNLTFETMVPLDEGANILTIQARDGRNLSSVKNLSFIGEAPTLSDNKTP